MKEIKVAEIELLKSEYERNFKIKGYISDFTSAFIFEEDKELQSIIHALKYEKKFLIGKYLGRLLAEMRSDIISEWKIDYIIPVPLHRLKLSERGYNQSYYIAKGLGRELSVPVKSIFVKRIKYTQSQTMLSRIERQANLSDAFKAYGKEIKSKKILIVDDVITTGATTNKCAKVLLEAGAAKVFAASAAVAG